MTATTSATTATDRRPRTGIRGLGLSAVVTAALLTGCGGAEDPYLAALRADPIASYAPTGADAELSVDQERQDPSGTTKGQQAKVLRSFRVRDPASASVAVGAAVARAQDVGWALESSHEHGASLTRPGPASSTMRLTVATSASEPTVVSLSMTAG